jgi:hypothetical protein
LPGQYLKFPHNPYLHDIHGTQVEEKNPDVVKNRTLGFSGTLFEKTYVEKYRM